MNSYGTLFRITTFGESHGTAIGVVVDGCPAGLSIDKPFIQAELDRRKPGQSRITTQRKENDTVQILSGVFDGQSTGAPIVLIIENQGQRSEDYDHLSTAFRPSHADYTYAAKYGIRDYRGGGRSAARETATRVAAGAIAKLILRRHKIDISAYVSQVGHIKTPPYTELNIKKSASSIICCPDEVIASNMIELIDEVRKNGDTIGGAITCVIQNAPLGLGDPVFAKLHAELGKAMLSINAVKGFEYGSGFSGIQLRGSKHNDEFYVDGKTVRTKTNYSGGIQGGISNGEDIYFNVAFKPVSTLMQSQQSINSKGEEVTLAGKGRHDPCVVPRAVPVVEAMAALVIVNFLLRQHICKI